MSIFKEILQACNSLGTLRLIVTSSAAVLQAQSKLEQLFYLDLPQGEYVNMQNQDFEFSLNMDKITQVKFEKKQANEGNFTTYAIHFLDDEQKTALSLLLQGVQPGEYEPGQVRAWQNLQDKYGKDNNSRVQTMLQNRYIFEEVLGKDEFQITYKANDTRESSRCVVKQFTPPYQDSRALNIAEELFKKEAENLQQLGRQHDQIPQLFAYFEENGKFYLVQEFINGHDLTSQISPTKKLNEEAVVELLKDILEVLVFVHQQNIIHQDIKPQNIIVRKQDGKIVLIDFSAVQKIKHLETYHRSKNCKTPVIGTPGYMPIEQERDRAQFCSDIYAVGMIAIQALTGLDINDIAQPIGDISWRDKAQNISNELANIIDKMVRYDFQKRYQSAQEVLRALNSPIINFKELDIKYHALRMHLVKQEWEKADSETVELMLEEANRKKQRSLNMESLENFPCEVLETIDALWVKYSKGKFGFSIQARIWKELVGNSNGNPDMYRKFGEKLGWVKPYEIFWYGNNLIFDIDKAPKGHLPVGRFGDISSAKKISGWVGGFGLQRIEKIVSKLSQCGIIE